MFEILKSFDIYYVQVLWNTNGYIFVLLDFFGCCYLLKLDDDYEKYDIYTCDVCCVFNKMCV